MARLLIFLMAWRRPSRRRSCEWWWRRATSYSSVTPELRPRRTFYKIPTAADLEGHVRREVHPRAAYLAENAEAFDVFPHASFDAMTWAARRWSDADVALRKRRELLGHVSKRARE